MKVFITGATGVLGREVVRQLSEAGHHVVGLVRDEDGATVVEKMGGEPHRGDVFDRPSLAEGIVGADAVVQAASKLPVDLPTTARDWRANDRVRLAGTRNLLSVAREEGVSEFVLPSVVWAVRDSNGESIDESSPPNPDRTTSSVIEAEQLVRERTRHGRLSGTILRFGWFYGPRSKQTQLIAQQLLSEEFSILGGGILGRKDTLISTIHVTDAASATVAAVESEIDGTYHVVDDQPITTAEFFRQFADQLGAPSPGRVPGWLAKHFIGDDMVKFLTQPFPTTNSKFCRITEWEPAYATIKTGLESVVQEWLRSDLLIPQPDGYYWKGTQPTLQKCRNCGRSSPSFYQSCRNCDSGNIVQMTV